jgi:hypothetical protein
MINMLNGSGQTGLRRVAMQTLGAARAINAEKIRQWSAF